MDRWISLDRDEFTMMWEWSTTRPILRRKADGDYLVHVDDKLAQVVAELKEAHAPTVDMRQQLKRLIRRLQVRQNPGLKKHSPLHWQQDNRHAIGRKVHDGYLLDLVTVRPGGYFVERTDWHPTRKSVEISARMWVRGVRQNPDEDEVDLDEVARFRVALEHELSGRARHLGGGVISVAFDPSMYSNEKAKQLLYRAGMVTVADDEGPGLLTVIPDYKVGRVGGSAHDYLHSLSETEGAGYRGWQWKGRRPGHVQRNPLYSAYGMHKKHPDTFELPDTKGVKVGDLVKVAGYKKGVTAGERFWVKVTSVKGDRFTGVVDNDASAVGYPYGKKISFSRSNIYDVWR